MEAIRELWRRLLLYPRLERYERELDEELRFHLEMKIEELVEEGLPPEEARYAALRSFGGFLRTKERCRDARGVRLLEDFVQDLRFSLRTLARNPGFALIAVLTLALGIGANTAIFSVVNALILSPPRIADARRVAAIFRTARENRSQGPFSYLELQDLRAASRSFETLAGYSGSGFILTRDGESAPIPGLRVTANFLSFLRVAPALGRDFQAAEEKQGAQPVALISHGFWKERFGGSQAALGSQLTLNGAPFTVVGVLPPGFEFPPVSRPIDVLTTLAVEGENLSQRGAQILRIMGRLRQGETFAHAQAELTGIAAGIERQHPDYAKDVTAYLVPVHEQIVGSEVRRALWVLLGAVGFLLLIACMNVTNLLLARATVRHKEHALRAALGAGKGRIARQVLTENLVIAALACGAGLLLSIGGLSAIRVYGAQQLPRLDEVRIDGRVLVFTMAVSVASALAFTLLPAFKASRSDLNEVLKAGAMTASTARSVRLWRDALVVAEVALGLVLLIGAGLMVRSFDKLVNVDPGFDPRNVLTGQITMTAPAYAGHEARAGYIDQTLARLRALPGVVSAAFVAPMPFSGGDVSGDFRIGGRPDPEPGQEPYASVRSVTPEYFQALAIPLRKGRYFTPQDQLTRTGAVIVNEALARKYFPDEDPIGRIILNIGANQHLGYPLQWEIVGVVGDVHHRSLIQAASPELYQPFQQNSWDWGNVFIRTTADPRGSLRSFSETLRAGDRTVAVSEVRPLAEAISGTVGQERFYTLLFSLFGAAGLLLMVTGVYSVIAYTVSRQTQEIGVRMALGARTGDVLRLVLGKGLGLIALGSGIGLAGALAVTHLIRTFLFGISPTDPATFAGATVLMVAVALAACYLPARRAAEIQPLVALRYE